MVLRRLWRGTFCIPPPRAPEERREHAPVTEFRIGRRAGFDTGCQHTCAGVRTHASRALNIEIARGAGHGFMRH